jgi:uncharacterized protein (TIGR00375 family)
LFGSACAQGDVLVFPRFVGVRDIKKIKLSQYLRKGEYELDGKFIKLKGNRAKPIFNEIKVDKEFCRLMGYYVSEGYTDNRDSISFCFKRNERNYVEDLKFLMKNIFGLSSPRIYKRKNANSIEVIYFSKILAKVFGKLFYNDKIQRRAHTKRLPNWVLQLPLRKQVEILKGWWRIWTPWFSLFGSKSGFDSIEECFEDYSKYIFAGETGLSSNPAMNWRLSALDRITLISCSDAHSPSHIGREANVFNCELSYFEIVKAIKEKDKNKFLYTIEFYPEEGKYHYDGHRNCGVSFSPKETKKYNGICPVCAKPLTIGVLNRVEQLADRPEGFVPENAIPFKSLIPLEEIIADALGQSVGNVEVEKEYKNLIEKFGNEFDVLLNASRSDLEAVTLPEIAEGILRAREGKVFIEPGYDGVYGKIRIFQKGEQKSVSRQGTLF